MAKNESFEKSIGRLEEIVRKMEEGSASLEESMKMFEEGTALAAACTRLLDEAEQKVVRLMKGADGEPVELPFDAEN